MYELFVQPHRSATDRFTQWVLDVFICNWLGTYLGWSPGSYLVIALYGHALSGMKVCQYFEVKVWTPQPYEIFIDQSVSIALFLAWLPTNPRNTSQNEKGSQSIFAS